MHDETDFQDNTRVERVDSGCKLGTIQVQRSSILRVVRGKGVGRTLRLGSSRVMAGRVAEADMVLDDPGASRRHFEVVCLPTGYVLRDLESTNGTMVNRVTVAECRLSDGDIITVGETDIGFFEETTVSKPMMDEPLDEVPPPDPHITRR